MKPDFIMDATVPLYFVQMHRFEIFFKMIEVLPAQIIITSEIKREIEGVMNQWATNLSREYSYISRAKELLEEAINRGTIKLAEKNYSDTAVRKFRANLRKKMSFSTSGSIDFGEASAFFLAWLIKASTIFSDDYVVPIVAKYFEPPLRVVGSPYLIKYGFLKRVVNYSTFVHLLFELQEKGGYKFLSLYDPKKRRIFNMYRDSILDGVHFIKEEIGDYVKDGKYDQIMERLNGVGVIGGTQIV